MTRKRLSPISVSLHRLRGTNAWKPAFDVSKHLSLLNFFVMEALLKFAAQKSLGARVERVSQVFFVNPKNDIVLDLLFD